MYQTLKTAMPSNSTVRQVGVFLELEGTSDDTSPRQINHLAALALRALADRVERMDSTRDVIDINKLGLFYGNMISVNLPLICQEGAERMQHMTLKAWQHQWNIPYGDVIADHRSDGDTLVKVTEGFARGALAKLSDYVIVGGNSESVLLRSTL